MLMQHKTDSRIEAKKKGSYDPLIYVGVFLFLPLQDINAIF
jgi:hypothetical protein